MNKIIDKLGLLISVIVLVLVFCYIFYTLFSANNILNSNVSENTTQDRLNVDNDINELESNTNMELNLGKNNEKVPIYTEVEIASYSSTLFDNSENRIFNITKATGILNDTIINPGDEFSFNNTIGPMGLENGYKNAIGFDSNGKNVQVPAGGMCQVSSTLYNVALLANLEITERHPHSKRVSYVPVDKDATIYYGSLDLKFINNTGKKIKITATNDSYTVTIKMLKIEESN